MSSIDQRAGIRILLADDEPPIRKMLALLLERNGCSVTLAVSGDQAASLAAAAAAPFDVLISDVCMPGLDGRTIAELLIAQGRVRKAIMISGSCEQVSRRVAGSPIQFLAKPFKPTELLATIRRLIEPEPSGMKIACCV